MCKRYCFLLVTTALIVVWASAYADARTGYRVHPGGTKLILPIETEDGRVISVSADSRQRIQLHVERPSSTVEYSTKGFVSSRRIEADFAALGRIEVRLDLVRFGPGVFHQRHCVGVDPIEGEGTYRGTIAFSQNGGVPEVSVTRGRVFFERRFRQVCRRRKPAHRPGPFPKLKRKIEEGALTVRGNGEGRTIRFDATIFAFRRYPGHSAGTLRALVYERLEGVRIARWRSTGFENSITMSRRGASPETVEVELPPPFRGHALYSRSSGSPPEWTGNLSVDLPGADGVPLHGPDFSARLCRGKVDRCLYGRGSDL